MKKRLLGISIIRILAMVLITCIHFLCYNKPILYFAERKMGDIVCLLRTINCFTDCSTSLFIIITGYFMYRVKRNNLLKIVKLWVEIITASIILLICYLIINGTSGIGIKSLLKTFFPLTTGHYWFFEQYSLLLLIVPAINEWIMSQQTEKFEKNIIYLSLIILIFFGLNPWIDSVRFLGTSVSVFGFIYFYLLGAYLNISDTINNKWVWGIIGPACFGIKYFMATNIINIQVPNNMSLEFITVLFTISIFILLKDINSDSRVINKVVSKIEECSFLVYIIQENDFMRNMIWTFFDARKCTSVGEVTFMLCAVIVCLWIVAYIIYKIFLVVIKQVDKIVPLIEQRMKKSEQ